MHSITVIAHDKLSDAIEAEVRTFLGDVEYKRVPVSDRAVDYLVADAPTLDSVRTFSNSKDNYDVVLQDVESRHNKQLFVFDMDSTLIYQEVIELIAAQADIEPQVAEITERAMNGELDFNESLRARVQLLKGIDATTLWDTLKEQIRITKGARELCAKLKEQGVVMAVCSGGFIPLAEYVKEQLGLDYAYANMLGVDEDNKLDGTTVGPIVNGARKAALLQEIAEKHGLDPKRAVAVGDGANDLPMMQAAGFGVAWNAKPTVRAQAPASLNSDTLEDILYMVGGRK